MCDLTKVKKKRVKWRKKCRQGWEGGGRNRKRHEDRRWMRRNGENWGEGREEKERGCAPRVEGDERATGVEEAVEADPSAWEKSPSA